MKTLTILLATFLFNVSGYAQEFCQSEMTGKVLQVTESEGPKFMKFTGEEVPSYTVVALKLSSSENREVAQQEVVTFKTNLKLAENTHYILSTNNSTICDSEEI